MTSFSRAQKQVPEGAEDFNEDVEAMTDTLKDAEYVDEIIKLMSPGLRACALLLARDKLNSNQSSSSSAPSLNSLEKNQRRILAACAGQNAQFQTLVDGDEVVDFNTVDPGLRLQIIGNYTVALIANYLAGGCVNELPTVQQGSKKGVREWFIENGMYFDVPRPLRE